MIIQDIWKNKNIPNHQAVHRYTANTLKLNHDTSTSESVRKDMMDVLADMIVGKHFENKSSCSAKTSVFCTYRIIYLCIEIDYVYMFPC